MSIKDRRQFYSFYEDKIPEKDLIRQVLDNAVIATPVKNNMYNFKVKVFGPEFTEEKRELLSHTACCGKSSTKSHTEIYLIFHLRVRASHLWVAPYNEYQQFLFDTITDFRKKGWNFQQFADWLNENGYTTVRGKRFRNAHTHSIVKKKKVREVRLNRRYEPEIGDFSLMFIDRSIIDAG